MTDLELVEDQVAKINAFTVDEASSTEDRRRFPRVKPRQRGLYGMSRYATDKLVDFIIARPPMRYALALISVLSLGAVWWIFESRMGNLEYNQDLVTQRAQLLEHLEELNGIWSREKVEEVLSKIDQAETRLFSDYPSLAAWLRDNHELATAFGLVMQYQLDATVSTRVRGVLEVPIALKVTAPATDDISYLKVMEFVKSLVEQKYYLEVRGATASSNGDGLKEMALDLRVWLVGDTPNGNEANEEVIE